MTDTMSIPELRDWLYRHPAFFNPEYAKIHDKDSVARILKAWTKKPFPFTVNREELQRVIGILMQPEHRFIDPIELLTTRTSFDTGIFMESKEFKESRRQTKEAAAPAEHFQKITDFWQRKYETERGYRDLCDAHRRENPDRYVFRDQSGRLQYCDGHQLEQTNNEYQPR